MHLSGVLANYYRAALECFAEEAADAARRAAGWVEAEAATPREVLEPMRAEAGVSARMPLRDWLPNHLRMMQVDRVGVVFERAQMVEDRRAWQAEREALLEELGRLRELVARHDLS